MKSFKTNPVEWYFHSVFKRLICSCRTYRKVTGFDAIFDPKCQNCYGKGVPPIDLYGRIEGEEP